MNGRVQLFDDRPIHGPYTQESRARWLRELLDAQRWIRDHAPEEVRDTQLITEDELREIRRIWVVEKHEFEDLLPAIYEQQLGEPYPDGPLDGHLPLGPEELAELRELCETDLHYQLVRDLLDVERRQKLSLRRRGLLDDLRGTIERHFYDDADDALALALRRRERREGDRSEPDASDEDAELLATHFVRPVPEDEPVA